MSSKCPKCGKKIKPTYLKQNCPECGVNMLYYNFDEKLKADAEQAKKEEDAINKFLDMLKASTIKTPWHIIRLALFFTPLASMSLPMFWAGHKRVSLITFLMSIFNHGIDMGAMLSDKAYLLAVLSMVLVVLLSIVEIICSLFSAAKKGFARNMIAYWVNTIALLAVSAVAVIAFDAQAMVGLAVTLGIYLVKLVLHFVTSGKGKKALCLAGAVVLAAASCAVIVPNMYKPAEYTICYAVEESDVSVVSFNVASAFGTSMEGTDSMERCKRFADYINSIKPDFVGTQEMNSIWLDKLGTELSDYEGYGVKRGGDSEEKNSEMNAVFWNKAKYEAVEKNTFWLSQTPDKESKYTYTDSEGKPAEAGCNRVCSYAVLRGADGIIIMMNTHLDNASEEARVFGAQLILDKIDELGKKYACTRFVLTGDFNEDINGDAVKLLSDRLNNTNPEGKGGATYQEWGYRNTGDSPIDFIFTTLDGVDYVVLDDIGGGYVSDHYGIYAGLKN